MIVKIRLAVSALALALAAGASAQSVDILQYSFDIDGTLTSNTEHGYADLSYTGTSGLQFLNLSFNGQWAIRDMPVFSQDGSGASHQVRLPFDLGINRGTALSSGSYAFTLSSSPTNAQPGGETPNPVDPYTWHFFSGTTDPFGAIGPAAAPTSGAGAANNTPALHKNFPNQDQDMNACVPTSISNSLQWLKAESPKDMKDVTDASITPHAVRDGMGLVFGVGAPAGASPRLKDAYMKSIKAPIATTTTTDWGKIVEEMAEGCDVELEITGHMVAISAIVALGGGRYSMVLNDDDQSVAGGMYTHESTYDTNTGKFDGSYSNRAFKYAMIECVTPVPEPSTMVGMGLAGLALLRRRRWTNRV